MAHQSQGLYPLIKDVFDRGNRRGNTGIILHNPVFHRHVKIDPHNDSFALKIDRLDCLYRHNYLRIVSLLQAAFQNRPDFERAQTIKKSSGPEKTGASLYTRGGSNAFP
jgi:hypothetical protein